MLDLLEEVLVSGLTFVHEQSVEGLGPGARGVARFAAAAAAAAPRLLPAHLAGQRRVRVASPQEGKLLLHVFRSATNHHAADACIHAESGSV